MITTVVNTPAADYLQIDPKDRDIYNRIKSDIESVSGFFTARFRKANENLRFYKPNQWTEAEKQEFIDNYRLPMEFNECHTKINHLVGVQKQTKLDAICRGRERGDGPYAELMSALLKWSEQINNVETLQGDVFKTSLIAGCAAAVVRWENRDVMYGRPVVEYVPGHEVTWDLNSTDMSLKDARWQARTVYMSRMSAREKMPEHGKIIDRANAFSEDFYGLRHERRHLFSHAMQRDHGRELIRIIEHYERVTQYRWWVSDQIEGSTFDFDEQSEAKFFYEELMNIYIDSDSELLYPDGSPKIVIGKTEKDSFVQTIIIGEEVAKRQITSLPCFPYIVNFCYYESGDYWAFMDYLIHPQRLINRFFAQWDYQLGTSTKNLVTIVKHLVDDSYTEDDIEDALSKSTPILYLKSHEAIKTHRPQSPQAELFQGINWAIVRMQEAAGGRNSLGLQENAAESGRAVIARSEQAGVGKLPLFDNLSQWRKQVASLLVWNMKNFMSPQQMTTIIGNSDEIKLQNIDGGVIDTLTEIEYDIVVSEAVSSDTVRERQFEQLLAYFQQVQTPPEIATPVLLEFSNIPETTREKIMGMMEFYQQYTAMRDQQNQQDKMSGEVISSLRKTNMKEQLSGVQQLVNPPEDQQLINRLRQSGNSPSTRNSAYNSLQNPGEIGLIPGSSVASSLSNGN